MPNLTPVDKIRTLMGAFDDGRSIRTAAAMAGVSKVTAHRYREEWLAGVWPEDARAAALTAYLAGRAATTGGRYTCGRNGNASRKSG